MERLTLETYFAIPRVAGLAVSPDGRRLVLPVQTLHSDGKRFVTALWQVMTDGMSAPRRLTFSAKGESDPAFRPDGSLVFTSARPDPTGSDDDDPDGGLWVLPVGGGEACRVLAAPGGIDRLAVARDSGAVVLKAPMYDGSEGLTGDAEIAKQRKDAGVSAILHDSYPVRFWDRDLGPRRPRLLRLADVTAGVDAVEDLTPDAGPALPETEFAVSPDGSTVVAVWWRQVPGEFARMDLVAIDAGGRRTLADDADYSQPVISPDGRWAVAVCERRPTPDDPPDHTLWLVELATGKGRDLTPGLDRWPVGPAWAPDSSAVLFIADDAGRAPLFRVRLDSGAVETVAGDAHFAAPCPDPSGDVVYALRSSYAEPPTVVRVDPDGSVTALPTPGLPIELPGRVEELSTQADDGVALRAWLVLPPDASAQTPAPLVLWVHGGPLSSWNQWSWRWCPHLLAERGYAVLLPDPALSTGYGRDFIARAWSRWGDRPFADLMAVTDAALTRPDLDSARTAAMGGSYGGYMANWIAGHTDRFRAIVTHASLWALDQFHGTSDVAVWDEREFGDPYVDPSRWLASSPHRHLDAIRTPMLVIHGERDFRVPISEALRLWTDLQRHGVPSQYLFFPDEGHWVLRPGNARVWYETVLAFLDHHVLGRVWERPDLL